MSMTPSELSLKIKSDGIAQAAKDLESLAIAAASVDKETKDFIVAQSKVQASTQQTGKSAEAAARGITTQELAMVKAHEAALKMHNTFLKQAATAEKLASSSEMTARGITKQELAMVKAHEAALKMNAAFDKQSDGLTKLHSHGSIWNNTLKSMIVAASAYVGVNFAKGIIEQADAWAMMQAKLKLAVGSMEGAITAQKNIYEMAQRTRIPLEEAVQLFTRMSKPLTMIGKSSSDTLGVVESFSLALKLAGATGQEASSAMLQFSQAMNAGRLNGAEFNAVAEASPNVLRAIEAELVRVGRGAELAKEGLKKMGSDGKISTEIMANALLNAKAKFEKDFQSLPLTVDGALTRIKNAWTKAIGEVGKDTKFNEDMAKALSKIEEMLPSIAKTIGSAFAFMTEHAGAFLTVLKYILAISVVTTLSGWVTAFRAAGLAAAAATASATAGVGLFTAALNILKANPIMLFLSGLAIAATNLYDLWSKGADAKQKLADKLTADLEQAPSLMKAMDAEISKTKEQIDLIRLKNGLPSMFSDAEKGVVAAKQLNYYEQANVKLSEAIDKVQAALAKKNRQEGGFKNIGTVNKELKDAQDLLEQRQRLYGVTGELAKAKQDEIDKTQQLAKQENKVTEILKLREQAKEATAGKDTKEIARLEELKQKIIDNGTVIDAKTGKEISGLSEVAKIEAKIAEIRKANTPKDKYKDEQSEIDKMIVSVSEYTKQLEQLRTYGVNDKRLESEKKLNELQAERALLAAKTVKDEKAISMKDAAIVQAEKAVSLQKTIVAETQLAKTQQDSLDTLDKKLEAAQMELEKNTALRDSDEQRREVLAELAAQQQYDIYLSSVKSGAITQEIEKNLELYEVLKKNAKTVKSDVAKDDYAKGLAKFDEMLDPNKATKFGDNFKAAMSKAVKSASDLFKVMQNVSRIDSDYNKASIQNSKLKAQAIEGGTSEIQAQADFEARAFRNNEDRSNKAITSWGNMAEASKGFFKEGTKGYQTLNAVSAVFHAAQLARSLAENAMSAISAVLNQGKGDPYSAFARMAAMGAIVAGLGFAVGAFGSSGSGGKTAAEAQKEQGTGSVFGDSSAKSDSLTKALDLLTKNYDKLYPVNVGMLNALKNIERGMSGLANIVARNAGVAEGTNMGIQEGILSRTSNGATGIGIAAGTVGGMAIGTNIGMGIGAIGGPIGMAIGAVVGALAGSLVSLWGKTTQNIVDSGIKIQGSLASIRQGQGISQYASVDTTKSSWFGLSKKTTNSMQEQGVSGELSSQIGLIFNNMALAMEEAAKVLYGKSEDVTKVLEGLSLSVSSISLKGLKGDDLTKALNAVISKSLDEMAEAAFKDFDKYRQVGEGYAETILRVANSFAVTNSIMSQIGLTLFKTNMAGIDASMAFTDMVGGLEELQSISKSYLDNYFTEEEKKTKTIDALTAQFKAMNEELPTTRLLYRKMVQDAAEAGESSKLATLLKLSDAFASVVKEAEKAADLIKSEVVNGAFDKFGVVLYNISVSSNEAANKLVTLAGGIDNLNNVTASYYENFYTDAEKTAASMASVSKVFKYLTGNALPTSREDFRAAVDRALQSGSGELAFSLMKLSDEFGKLYPIVDKVALAAEAAKKAEEDLAAANVARLKPLNDLKEAFKALTEDANKWLSIRNKATDLRATLDTARGIKSDPAMRIKKLWDAMNSDASPEQKLELAGQLKDLLLSKYQIEKDSLTKLIDFGKQLRGYVEGLKIGSLSPLTMTQKIAEAQRQYETTLAKAKGGDTVAQGGLQNAANNYLQLAQTAFASGQQYQDIFNLVTTSLDNLGLESMTYDQQSLNLASSQLAELEKLDNYLAAIESNADSHYNQTISTMVTQLSLIDSMEKKLGELSSIKATLDGLPAQIAASMYRQQNANFVTELYSKFAGKTGTQIDTQGMEYWINEVAKYGTMYTEKAFKDSVAFVNGLVANPPPAMANNKVEIEALTKEVASLREDNAKQTMALIEATLAASNKNADTVVAGTKDALNSTVKKEVVIK